MKCKLTKASTYTHAKRGYFVFCGDYPNMKHKYFKNKSKAIQFKKGMEK